VHSIIIVFELHINGTQNYFKKCLPVSPCPLSNVTLALTRQDSKNGLPSYHGGYEINPYGSNGGALESDSAESYDYGGGENGTLQDEHVQATS
jgi:hypothetical protein